MKHYLAAFALAATTLLTCVLPAGAQTWVSTSPLGAPTATITRDGVNLGNAYLTPEKITKVSATNGGLNDTSLLPGWDGGYAFCVDLYDYTRSPQPTNVQFQSGTEWAWLYTEYSKTATSNNDLAALQVAIWEAKYDGHTLLFNGSTLAQLAALPGDSLWDKASAMLAAADAHQGEWGSRTVLFLEGTQHLGTQGYQDMITGTVVPEPGAMALLLPGLAPLGLVLRRRRR